MAEFDSAEVHKSKVTPLVTVEAHPHAEKVWGQANSRPLGVEVMDRICLSHEANDSLAVSISAKIEYFANESSR